MGVQIFIINARNTSILGDGRDENSYILHAS